MCCESQGIKAKCNPYYESEFCVTDYLQSAKLNVTVLIFGATELYISYIKYLLCMFVGTYEIQVQL